MSYPENPRIMCFPVLESPGKQCQNICTNLARMISTQVLVIIVTVFIVFFHRRHHHRIIIKGFGHRNHNHYCHNRCHNCCHHQLVITAVNIQGSIQGASWKVLEIKV